MLSAGPPKSARAPRRYRRDATRRGDHRALRGRSGTLLSWLARAPLPSWLHRGGFCGPFRRIVERFRVAWVCGPADTASSGRQPRWLGAATPVLGIDATGISWLGGRTSGTARRQDTGPGRGTALVVHHRRWSLVRPRSRAPRRLSGHRQVHGRVRAGGRLRAHGAVCTRLLHEQTVEPSAGDLVPRGCRRCGSR